jgi:phage shock protein C
MSYTTNYRKTLYRSRSGWIFGVCRGVADYAEIPVFWIRLACIAACAISAFWPVALIYILAAIFIKPAPVVEINDADSWDFYNTYMSDKQGALDRLRRKFDSLDRRTRRMESMVTAKEYDWERRLNAGAKS